jgi:hypothetical protein
MNLKCQCRCGAQKFEVRGTPVMRFICHCIICQKVYQKPFADVVAVKASQIVRPLPDGILFTRHKGYPNVNRGVCVSCSTPVVGFMPVIPFFGLSFVPASNFEKQSLLPKASMHTFYHRRQHDVNDDIPKVSGYWQSQLGVTQQFMSQVLKR